MVVLDHAYMFDELFECFLLLYQAWDLLQILQSSGGFDRAIGLEHRDIARFLHDEFGQLAGAELASLVAPAFEISGETGQRAARPLWQVVGVGDKCRGRRKRDALAARDLCQRRDAFVPQSALGRVADALERAELGRANG